jgi:tRNA-uridine 2-sulfurtransferase
MRIAVAMSGGVDSSVAAALLAREGHDVVGLSMQLYDSPAARAGSLTCCGFDDLQDARRVAAAIGIPHYVIDCVREFEDLVIADFVAEYVAGRTPVPCVPCNRDLKFGALLTRALGIGAERVATGHYARVMQDAATGRHLLTRGTDRSRDQSYFLFSLGQDQLARASFPLGGWTKEAVRSYARRHHLPVADKRASQEVCFVRDGRYAGFIEDRVSPAPPGGTIVDRAGVVLGCHRGVHHFTVGQRKRLGISGAEPQYVLAIRRADNTVVVGPRGALEKGSLTASRVNWIAGDPPACPVDLTVQIRYRHPPALARIRALEGGRATVQFTVPQLAVTPGQAAVFYDGDIVVGGGWID